VILSQKQIREAVQKNQIRFDPPVEKRQWAEASVNLRLGLKFTQFKAAENVTFSMAGGIRAITDTGLYHEEVFEIHDVFGKRRKYVLEPNEFILAQTYEHVWIPRHLIGMVEGRSTYARVGLSMHQTAPWLQPGWDGHITLEIRNSGRNKIELTPMDDMPCQITFFQLTSKIPKKDAYGSRPTDAFQHQTSTLPKRK
jgi:dCTP deaminase